MDINILHSFLIVAREQNITKSAQLLHVSQPTLSRQLMQLENELGTKLFIRSNHNVVLTHEGFIFRRRAQELVNLAERAKNEIIETSDNISGYIAIGSDEIQAVKELAGLIAEFQNQFPKVKFDLYSGSNEEIQEKLEQGTLDIGIFLEPFDFIKYKFIRMKTIERWGVLLHKENPLAEKKYISPGELVGTLVVTTHIDTLTHSVLTEWSGEYAKEMDFCANYNVLHNGVILARERKGAVICLEPDCNYADMKFLPFEPPLKYGSVLAWKENQINTRALKTFLQFLENNI